MYIKPRRKKLIINLVINLLLLFIVVLILFGISELFLRGIQGSERIENTHGEIIFASDEILGHVMKPNFNARFKKYDFNTEFSTNSQGFRDTEFTDSQNLDANQSIIFMLGDSFTAGTGVEENQTHSSLLQETLLPTYTVYNLGVSGYSQRQQAIQLERYLPQYNPEIVILNFYIGNDLTDNCAPLNIIGREKSVSEKTKEFFKKSHVITTIYRKTIAINNQPRDLEYYLDSKAIQECYDITEQHLKKIKTLAQNSNTKLLLVLIPREAQTEEEEKLQLLEHYSKFSLYSENSDEFNLYTINKKLEDLCTQLEIDCLDLTQSFIDNQAADLYVADGHWNAQGHKLAAQEIIKHLENNNFLI
jgi:lysophospholipase L1-like esterase